MRSEIMEQIYDGLGEQLGRSSVRMVDDAGAVAYSTPGLGNPLLVFLHEMEPEALVRVEVPVVRRADWGMGELSSVLLAEQAKWAFGRVERRAEGIVIEQCFLADTAPHKLAALINCLADTAIRLRADLGRMGALTLFEKPPSEDDRNA